VCLGSPRSTAIRQLVSSVTRWIRCVDAFSAIHWLYKVAEGERFELPRALALAVFKLVVHPSRWLRSQPMNMTEWVAGPAGSAHWG